MITTTKESVLKSEWIEWCVALAVGVEGLYIVASTAYWTFRSLSPIPYWDSWGTVIFLAQGGTLDWHWLWSQANEHRIVVPRLISLADIWWFGGRGYFSLALIWLMQSASALIIASFSLDVIGWSREKRPWRILISGLIVCLTFSAAQMENFYWPFQTAFVGTLFLSLLAFFCLKRSHRANHPLAWIGGGALAAISSALFLASGIVTMYVFAFGCWIAGAQRRTVLSLMAIFATVTAAYFHGYSSPILHSSPKDSLLHRPLLVFQYVLVFMGNPWGRKPLIAALIGTWGLGLFLIAASLASIKRTDFDNQLLVGNALSGNRPTDRILPTSVGLFCIATLVIAQSFVTALGRCGFGIGQALASRYITPVSFFWLATLVLAAAVVLEFRRWVYLVAAYCGMVSIMTGYLTVQNGRVGKSFAGRVAGLELAANALRVGVVDLTAYSVASPWPDAVEAARPFLIQHRLSVFADDRYTWLGRRVSEVASPSPSGSCLGSFDIASGAGVQGGAKVQGWAWSRPEMKSPTQVLLVDDAGIIVGLATGGIQRPDVLAVVPEVTDAGIGWEGYAKGARAVSAYALIESGRATCRLPGSFNAGLGALQKAGAE